MLLVLHRSKRLYKKSKSFIEPHSNSPDEKYSPKKLQEAI